MKGHNLNHFVRKPICNDVEFQVNNRAQRALGRSPEEKVKEFGQIPISGSRKRGV